MAAYDACVAYVECTSGCRSARARQCRGLYPPSFVLVSGSKSILLLAPARFGLCSVRDLFQKTAFQLRRSCSESRMCIVGGLSQWWERSTERLPSSPGPGGVLAAS